MNRCVSSFPQLMSIEPRLHKRKQRSPAERFNLTLKPIEGVIDPRLVRLKDAIVAAQVTQSGHPEKPHVHELHRCEQKQSLQPHNTTNALAVHPLEARKLRDLAGVVKLTATSSTSTCRITTCGQSALHHDQDGRKVSMRPPLLRPAAPAGRSSGAKY